MAINVSRRGFLASSVAMVGAAAAGVPVVPAETTLELTWDHELHCYASSKLEWLPSGQRCIVSLVGGDWHIISVECP